MPKNPDRLVYTMQRGDYMAMMAAMYRLPLSKRLLLFIAFPFALAAMLYLWGLLTASGEDMSALVGAALTGRMSLAFYVFFGSLWVTSFFSHSVPMLMAATNYNSLGSRDVEFQVDFGPAGVDFTSKLGTSHIAWESVRRLIRTHQHIFLAVSKRQAAIVPRRAFASDQAFDAAWQRAVGAATAAEVLIY